MKNITLGQYYSYDSPIHRLDARLKIIATFTYLIIIFFVKDIVGYGFVTLCLGSVIAVSGVPIRFIARGMKPIMFILAITFLMNLFLSDGRIIFEWRIFKITEEGLIQASYISFRLILLVFGASMLTYTTRPLALTDGFEGILKPLVRFGVPSHEIAMMMSIALRFIPTLMSETDKIMKAQKARGADFESGNIVRRVKNLIPLLIPLFIRAFGIAQDLALAMEARCYHGGKGRTRLNPMKYERRDLIAFVLLAIFVTLLLLQSNGLLPIPLIWEM